MSLPIYRHADGGHYVIIDDVNHTQKMEDGSWKPAVLYRGVERDERGHWRYLGARTHSTTWERWQERFVATGETTARLL